MAGTALRGRLTWQLAELATAVAETPRVTTILFDVPGWPGHRAGQHVDVRLTAQDGYQAERSYSIASAPAGPPVALTVHRLQDGEVSPYLTGEPRPGDTIELRGPIGGYFAWDPAQGGPLMLVAGGSGIVPLMAMIRTRAAAGDDTRDAVALLLTPPARHHLPRRAHPAQRQRPHRRARAHRSATPPVDQLRAPCRRRDARRGFAYAGRAAAFARVRADAVPRGGGRIARPARTRHAGHQDRTLRAHRTVTWASRC